MLTTSTDRAIAASSKAIAERGAVTAAELLAQAGTLVEPTHRAVVDRLPEEIRLIAGYHAGWWDARGRPAQSERGKMIRPALTFAAARAAHTIGFSDERAVEAAVPAAVAVQLTHDFSLLHDDVMDGDLTRRGRASVWSVFGIGQAILAGDTLLAMATDIVADGPGLKVLTGAILQLCSGQNSDLVFETRGEVSIEQCVEMALGKTGALLGAACELGALATGADAVKAGRYRECGRHLGLAFQLVDDLLGIWGDPAMTGKPTGSDLASRKKSLPVVAALTSGTLAGEQLSREYEREDAGDERALAHLAGLVEQAGGRDWARAEADRQLTQALNSLDKAHPQPQGAEELRLLAAAITRRKH